MTSFWRQNDVTLKYLENLASKKVYGFWKFEHSFFIGFEAGYKPINFGLGRATGALIEELLETRYNELEIYQGLLVIA